MPIIHMPRKLIFNILKEAEEIGVLNINITGGEPFLHPDIWEILKWISSSKMQLHLNSNFSILEKREIEDLATLLYGAHLDVTVHSSKDNFSTFTGVSSDFYDKVINNIKYAYDLGIDVGVAITVNKMNQSSIPKIVEDVRKISENIPVTITLTHPTGRALENWGKLQFDEREVVRLIRNSGFKNIMIQRHYPSYNFTQSYLDHVKETKIDVTGCPCGTFSAFIWPDGRCTWCPYSVDEPFVMGNITANGSILSIWKKDQPHHIKEIRKSKLKCKSCPFFNVCRGGCPIDTKNLKGTIYERDPFCEKYLGDLPWKFKL